MPLHVERQVVRTAKGTCAQLAAERLETGVLPVVSRQLVGPSEAPHAALPGADVWLFTCAEEKKEKK